MAAKKEYKVKAALVQVPDGNGKMVHLYRGATVPDSASEPIAPGSDRTWLDHLLELGMIAEDKNDEIVPVLAASPVEL